MKETGMVVGVAGAMIMALAFAVLASRADDTPKRPKIYGIAGVRVAVTDAKAATKFYSKILETDRPCVWCGDRPYRYPLFFAYNDQHLILDPAAATNPQVAFFTDSVPAMQAYLVSKGVALSVKNRDVTTSPKVGEALGADSQTVGLGPELRTVDTEGHTIVFVQRPTPERKHHDDEPIMRIIHAGWVVKDRAKMDAFYKDILGFHLYWQGGMKDGETSWVSMQVPDGTDWIEYMLNIPEDADKHLLGVMNHIALGVPDVHAAARELEARGMKLPEQPKLGRDGKWQLNLYDPDLTRVELMEFTPVEKPCCSEFTGPHPKP